MKNKIKGIILAGGYGSRLFPLTKTISKQLLPVYDKPMIYYPLSILMMSGIRDILIISTSRDLPRFKNLLKDGNQLGLNLSYIEQSKPNGIAEAFILGEEFIGNNNVCLILGDNIFHGKGFVKLLNEAVANLINGYSSIFSTTVENPNEFGVIEFSKNFKIKKIVEKPENFIGNNIVSGLYFYTNDVIQISKNLKPSKRGELEITEINNCLLNLNSLKVIMLDSSFYWSDTGTYDSLIKASKFFQEYENKTGNKLACIEEIALKLGYINNSAFVDLANSMIMSSYGRYLYAKSKKI